LRLIGRQLRSTLFPYTTLFRSFRVKATNNDGVWNNEGINLIIEVRPPWWRTWWFRILLLLVIGAVVYRYITYKTERLKENQRIRSEEHTSELQSRENLVCRLLL